MKLLATTIAANKVRIETTYVNDLFALFLTTSPKDACFIAAVPNQPTIQPVKSCFKVTFKPVQAHADGAIADLEMNPDDNLIDLIEGNYGAVNITHIEPLLEARVIL